MWNRNHEHCVECKTTDSRYMAKGLCVRCYLKRYREAPENKQRIAASKRAWYDTYVTKQVAKEKRERDYFDSNREKILARDGYKCLRCGSQENLVVHHKDRTGRGSMQHNNQEENLETLCRKCHLDEHRPEYLAIRRSKHTTPQLGKSGRWSIKFDECVSCHETTSKHIAYGLCSRCYQRQAR